MMFKKNGGFTLVELIVVIAILAILAGIAVPAYSGYIAKANEAADMQLLGALNTAFNAACVENGIDVNAKDEEGNLLMKDAEFTMTGEEGAMTITGLTFPAAVESATLAARNTQPTKAELAFESFKIFYGDNMDKAFKVFVQIVYGENGFEGKSADEATVAVTINGVTINVSREDAAKLAASTFGTATGLGAEGLLTRVEYVTGFAEGLLNSDDPNAFATVLGGDSFKQSMAAAMGILNASTLTGEQLDAAIEAQMVELGYNNPEAASKVMANSAVLYAAQNASGMDKTAITSLLTNAGTKATIAGNLSKNPGETMAQAALAYGMYTAYAYQSQDDELITQIESGDPTSVLNNLDDEGFEAYMKSEQGQADLDAYMSALGMINQGATSSDAASSVLANGFNTPEMQAMLNSIMGVK